MSRSAGTHSGGVSRDSVIVVNIHNRVECCSVTSVSNVSSAGVSPADSGGGCRSGSGVAKSPKKSRTSCGFHYDETTNTVIIDSSQEEDLIEDSEPHNPLGEPQKHGGRGSHQNQHRQVWRESSQWEQSYMSHFERHNQLYMQYNELLERNRQQKQKDTHNSHHSKLDAQNHRQAITSPSKTAISPLKLVRSSSHSITSPTRRPALHLVPSRHAQTVVSPQKNTGKGTASISNPKSIGLKPIPRLPQHPRNSYEISPKKPEANPANTSGFIEKLRKNNPVNEQHPQSAPHSASSRSHHPKEPITEHTACPHAHQQISSSSVKLISPHNTRQLQNPPNPAQHCHPICTSVHGGAQCYTSSHTCELPTTEDEQQLLNTPHCRTAETCCTDNDVPPTQPWQSSPPRTPPLCHGHDSEEEPMLQTLDEAQQDENPPIQVDREPEKKSSDSELLDGDNDSWCSSPFFLSQSFNVDEP
ncbi:hypothetical protein Pelo_8323 [Pelomyxa schiedti]|nr:hypothetical protein Pelo_8323 [Pelomyxa schiedti]